VSLSVQRESLASCPCCACLVLAWSYPGTEPVIRDPSFVQERFIRSFLGRDAVERQGFGIAPECGALHECPPESDCRIQAEDRWPTVFHEPGAGYCDAGGFPGVEDGPASDGARLPASGPPRTGEVPQWN